MYIYIYREREGDLFVIRTPEERAREPGPGDSDAVPLPAITT